nr:MAG TPA: hypothetical protein [Caudoviricetes sp.]
MEKFKIWCLQTQHHILKHKQNGNRLEENIITKEVNNKCILFQHIGQIN